jgi:outer membrane protein assembly factor BamB
LIVVANEGAAASAFDVSDHTKAPKIVWQWEGDLPDAASPVANNDFLIVPTAFGVVTCLSMKTGKVHWEHEFDQGFNSSPVLVGDRVYLTDLSGTTHVIKLSEQFTPLGIGDVGEPVYATPAFTGERMFIRGLAHLFCVGETPKS